MVLCLNSCKWGRWRDIVQRRRGADPSPPPLAHGQMPAVRSPRPRAFRFLRLCSAEVKRRFHLNAITHRGIAGALPTKF